MELIYTLSLIWLISIVIAFGGSYLGHPMYSTFICCITNIVIIIYMLYKMNKDTELKNFKTPILLILSGITIFFSGVIWNGLVDEATKQLKNTSSYAISNNIANTTSVGGRRRRR
jgi:uncharacterized membrane protein